MLGPAQTVAEARQLSPEQRQQVAQAKVQMAAEQQTVAWRRQEA